MGGKLNKQYVYEFRTRRIRRSMAMDAPVRNAHGPDDVANIVRHVTRGDARESFLVFMLDAKGGLIGYEVVAVGLLTHVDVHPREVFRPAIVAPAASIIVAHNHPSGDSAPSPEDCALTERLGECGELLGIPLLDHVVVGNDDFVSIYAARTAKPANTKDDPK